MVVGPGGAGEPDPAGGERLPKGCLPWLRGATAAVVSKEGLAAMMAFMTGCANVGCMVRYDAYGTMMTVRKSPRNSCPIPRCSVCSATLPPLTASDVADSSIFALRGTPLKWCCTSPLGASMASSTLPRS